MDPFVTLATAAAVTKRLKLGTGVCLVIQRDTIQTAKLVASLDQISSGRLLFGTGGGWKAEEIENHGTEFTSRFKKMREQIEAMKEIWTKSTAEYHGDLVDFSPMMTWPKPVQKPHPPVILGGAFPWAARRAVRYGDGWYPNAASGNPDCLHGLHLHLRHGGAGGLARFPADRPDRLHRVGVSLGPDRRASFRS